MVKEWEHYGYDIVSCQLLLSTRMKIMGLGTRGCLLGAFKGESFDGVCFDDEDMMGVKCHRDYEGDSEWSILFDVGGLE